MRLKDKALLVRGLPVTTPYVFVFRSKSIQGRCDVANALALEGSTFVCSSNDSGVKDLHKGLFLPYVVIFDGFDKRLPKIQREILREVQRNMNAKTRTLPCGHKVLSLRYRAVFFVTEEEGLKALGKILPLCTVYYA